MSIDLRKPWFNLTETEQRKGGLLGPLHSRRPSHSEQVRDSQAARNRASCTHNRTRTYAPTSPFSAEYLASQREAFIAGYPPFDFSGGEGESRCAGRATQADAYNDIAAQRAVGFEKFEADPAGGAARESLVLKANEWLFV